jgi:hypothetical protein
MRSMSQQLTETARWKPNAQVKERLNRALKQATFFVQLLKATDLKLARMADWGWLTTQSSRYRVRSAKNRSKTCLETLLLAFTMRKKIRLAGQQSS